MASGSKRNHAGTPPELTAWQSAVLEAVGKSPLAAEITFGGGAALAAVYLHHRRSEDLDFFCAREVEQHEIQPLARSLARRRILVDQRVVGPRRILELSRRAAAVGHIDIAYYPFDPVDRPMRWRGLRVDSLSDMAVNKLQAVLTRFRPRDYVDLYFLLQEGPERDLVRLLAFVRAKFDVGADVLTLAERFLHAAEIGTEQLPRMLRSITAAELRSFFEAQARRLVRTA